MALISLEEARLKPKKIFSGLTPAVEKLINDILDKKDVFTPANSDDTPDRRKLTALLEDRLASFGDLADDQANGIWGGSTSIALEHYGKRYNLGFNKGQPAIGQSFMLALLDGQRPNREPLASVNTYEWVRQQVAAAGHTDWESRNGFFEVVGIRGYRVAEGVVENVGDVWNDVIVLCWADSAGKHARMFAATVDPGLYYYAIHPTNAAGCAHLVPGRYLYQPGLHNGHPAFIEKGPVTVARTNAANFTDRSLKQTDNPPDNAFWIDIHAGFEYGAEAVYNSSAGCQCIKSAGWNGWQWQEFHRLLSLNQRGWFHYTLLDGRQLRTV